MGNIALILINVEFTEIKSFMQFIEIKIKNYAFFRGISHILNFIVCSFLFLKIITKYILEHH